MLGTLSLYILKMHTFLGYIIPLLLHSAKQNEHIISTLLLEGFFFPGLNIFVEETSFLDIKSNALGDHLRFFACAFVLCIHLLKGTFVFKLNGYNTNI